MPRVSLQNLYEVPDILSGDAFYFLITNIPGSGGNHRNLALKCLNVQVAGESNEKMTVALHSHQINFRGRRIQPQTLSVTYYEDQTMDTWKIMRGWHEYIVGTNSGNSRGFKADYSTNATCEVYNHKGEMIKRTNYYKVFLADLPDITFDGSSSTPLQVPITLSYDSTDDNNVPAT